MHCRIPVAVKPVSFWEPKSYKPTKKMLPYFIHWPQSQWGNRWHFKLLRIYHNCPAASWLQGEANIATLKEPGCKWQSYPNQHYLYILAPSSSHVTQFWQSWTHLIRMEFHETVNTVMKDVINICANYMVYNSVTFSHWDYNFGSGTQQITMWPINVHQGTPILPSCGHLRRKVYF